MAMPILAANNILAFKGAGVPAFLKVPEDTGDDRGFDLVLLSVKEMMFPQVA